MLVRFPTSLPLLKGFLFYEFHTKMRVIVFNFLMNRSCVGLLLLAVFCGISLGASFMSFIFLICVVLYAGTNRTGL